MRTGFRQSMAWLHTWTGLLVGWILLLIFSAGTAAYFRDEITLWMKPELHLAARHPVLQAQAIDSAIAQLQLRAPQSPRWFINLPTARDPAVRIRWGSTDSVSLDPASGQPLTQARATLGGEFFYRLHFDLHYIPAFWARLIVGFCAMVMLVAIVSGIVTHKKIFADFFTFRPGKGQRSWLDAHTTTAVLALPYHLMITYTGLVTMMFLYMPWGAQTVYRDHGGSQAFFADLFPAEGVSTAKAEGKPAPLVALAPLLAQASAHWGGAPVGRLVVSWPNDAGATVGLMRQEGRGLSSDQPSMLFNGVTGALIATHGDAPRPAAQTRGVLYGLHLGRFASPLLRALFFASGLVGCLMVATGLLLWATKEREKQSRAAQEGRRKGFAVQLVDALNIGTIAGLPIAFASYFWANRLLPVVLADRPAAEILCFFGAWGAAAMAGFVLPVKRMWQVQLMLGATLFALLPMLNALTTPTHLGVSLAHPLWPVAGFDLVVLLLGMGLGFSARQVGRPRVQRKPASPAAASPPPESGTRA